MLSSGDTKTMNIGGAIGIVVKPGHLLPREHDDFPEGSRQSAATIRNCRRMRSRIPNVNGDISSSVPM
ncbi:MAG: hypothetical protein DWH84_00430 [Planctomycetota bacterium]|nr:MAG: hypothetical protein DWH84_00430 [Planctomycetota bacterium]